ncbi:MAG: hypothetical protein ACREAX_04325 [Candidatus Nitrosotenuis sp.]
MKEETKCSSCNGKVEQKYIPMKEWDMSGFLCGKCYSERLSGHYPGEHVRVNLDKK